jgi:hypothetical protein
MAGNNIVKAMLIPHKTTVPIGTEVKAFGHHEMGSRPIR